MGLIEQIESRLPAKPGRRASRAKALAAVWYFAEPDERAVLNEAFRALTGIGLATLIERADNP